MTGYYKIAERNIRITSLHGQVHEYCRDYRADGPGSMEEADVDVCITQADIDFERVKDARERELESQRGLPERGYDPTDGDLEILAVYRKIAESMPFYDTFLIHGSAIAVDGEAFLFAALSGTGKSTHARLWREMLKDRAVMVNDDKPLIRMTDEGPVIYGTPWDGKHRLSSNIAVPLKAVCLLERAPGNAIRPVTSREIYPLLLQQVYRPMDKNAMIKTLGLLDRLCRGTAFFRLGCNMEPEAAAVSFEAMVSNEAMKGDK